MCRAVQCDRICAGSRFMETRLLMAYGLIALLIAGVAAAVVYMRRYSRKAVERRRRTQEREQRRIHSRKEA